MSISTQNDEFGHTALELTLSTGECRTGWTGMTHAASAALGATSLQQTGGERGNCEHVQAGESSAETSRLGLRKNDELHNNEKMYVYDDTQPRKLLNFHERI